MGIRAFNCLKHGECRLVAGIIASFLFLQCPAGGIVAARRSDRAVGVPDTRGHHPYGASKIANVAQNTPISRLFGNNNEQLRAASLRLYLVVPLPTQKQASG